MARFSFFGFFGRREIEQPPAAAIDDDAVHLMGMIRDPSVRQAALKVLSSSGPDRPAVITLCDAFTGAVIAQDAGTIGVLLVPLRHAATTLISFLQDKDQTVRVRGAQLLQFVKDPRAAEPLAAALKDARADVRLIAVQALREIDTRQAVDALTGALNHYDPNVRQASARALQRRRQ